MSPVEPHTATAPRRISPTGPSPRTEADGSPPPLNDNDGVAPAGELDRGRSPSRSIDRAALRASLVASESPRQATPERTQQGFSRAVWDRHKRRRTFVGSFGASSEASRDAVRSAEEARDIAQMTWTNAERSHTLEKAQAERLHPDLPTTTGELPRLNAQSNLPLFLCRCEPFSGCH